MKTNNVEIIKADSLVRRRGFNVERHLKRVAAYCRVSSDSEDQKNSYESQVRHYKDYISQRSDWELADIYADVYNQRLIPFDTKMAVKMIK